MIYDILPIPAYYYSRYRVHPARLNRTSDMDKLSIREKCGNEETKLKKNKIKKIKKKKRNKGKGYKAVLYEL